MINWTAIGSFATAISTAFVAWEAYETQTSNRLEIKHNENIEKQHREENSVKAINRFDDKILPSIQTLFHIQKLNTRNYWLALHVMLSINRWAVYVNSPITETLSIKLTLYYTIRNFNSKYGYLAKVISNNGLYNLSGYFDILTSFDILKMRK